MASETAERAFSIMAGRVKAEDGERPDLIYSRFSHPNAEILEDQIVPLEDSSRLTAQLVKDATLKVYPGAPHGLANTTAYKDTFNADLLAFLRG